jgi:hypothetical protein
MKITSKSFSNTGGFAMPKNANAAAQSPLCQSVDNHLEETRTYTIQGKTFIVEPVFKTDSGETVGTILLRLIQSDKKNKKKA